MRVENIYWSQPKEHELLDETFEVIFEATYTNVTFRFGVPKTYNRLSLNEVGFFEIHFREEERSEIVVFDRNELLDFWLGLGFIANQQLRLPGEEPVTRSEA